MLRHLYNIVLAVSAQFQNKHSYEMFIAAGLLVENKNSENSNLPKTFSLEGNETQYAVPQTSLFAGNEN